MILHTETSKLMLNWSFLFEVLHKPTLLPSTFKNKAQIARGSIKNPRELPGAISGPWTLAVRNFGFRAHDVRRAHNILRPPPLKGKSWICPWSMFVSFFSTQVLVCFYSSSSILWLQTTKLVLLGKILLIILCKCHTLFTNNTTNHSKIAFSITTINEEKSMLKPVIRFLIFEGSTTNNYEVNFFRASFSN